MQGVPIKRVLQRAGIETDINRRFYHYIFAFFG